MDNVTKTLEVLLLELPDTEQELSPQKLTPKTFTCFPKFPLEIRRMVWTQSLPGRRFIDLNRFQNAGEGSRAGAIFHCKRTPRTRQRDPKAPTALQINQESRSIALAHYTMMYNHCWFVDCDQKIHRVRRYLSIDPKVDLVYMSAQNIFQHSRHYPLAFQHFAQNTECFRDIESLEIRGFDWYLMTPAPGGDHIEWKFGVFIGGFLNLFPGLKELHLVDQTGKPYRDESLGDNLELLEEDLEILYRWYKDNAGTHPPEALRSIPKIIPHDNRRIEARSDDANREFGRIPCSSDNKEAACTSGTHLSTPSPDTSRLNHDFSHTPLRRHEPSVAIPSTLIRPKSLRSKLNSPIGYANALFKNTPNSAVH